MDKQHMNLNQIRLGYHRLSQSIMLYRHGKDPQVALDRREAHRDVFEVLIHYLMDDAPRGSSQDIRLGERWYRVIVCPINGPKSQTHSYQPSRTSAPIRSDTP